jgi:PHP family Zn ribbon phosphoesterase
MITITADLHLHSKYSRAVSPQMVLPVMAHVAKQKGLDLLATGDWTHPLWFKELQEQLEEAEEGAFRIKNKHVIPTEVEGSIPRGEDSSTTLGMTIKKRDDTRFLLSVEISCIYSQNGKGRRVHNVVLAPSFATAEKINKRLLSHRYNLSSDGRPIIGMSSKHLLQTILEIDEKSLLIPAHIWTPWFGVYGEKSGFNSLEECFEELAPYVYGIETGLSSDPEMNWQMKELATRSILSFSDAHSPAKMGREATVFELESLSYDNIRKAIMRPSVIAGNVSPTGSRIGVRDDIVNRVLYTIEFYPEEGKYHYSGHRNCHVIMTPDQQRDAHGICPVCGRNVTDGVMRRVEELGNQDTRYEIQDSGKDKIMWIIDNKKNHPPFVKIVPLNEIIAESMGRPVTSPKVKVMFDVLCANLQSELHVLLHASLEEIARIAGSKIAEGIQRVRSGSITINPGYDGVYGTVSIWPKKEKEENQLSLKL